MVPAFAEPEETPGHGRSDPNRLPFPTPPPFAPVRFADARRGAVVLRAPGLPAPGAGRGPLRRDPAADAGDRQRPRPGVARPALSRQAAPLVLAGDGRLRGLRRRG